VAVGEHTVEQWLSFWLESILPLSVRWKTLSGYASLMRVHVMPTIGPLPLTEVRPETLERLYRKLLDEGSSTPLVHAVHRTFRSSLSEAVRRERLASNPAARARPTRVETVEIQPLSAVECQDILRARRSSDPAAAPRLNARTSSGPP
jgi:hypothetical protein